MSNKTQKISSSDASNSAYNLSNEIETEGFDYEAGQTWIYPSNYPEREYQFSIIQQALLKNTLVSLPTGLGKTFIAAVVMYNFYRWYPLGKIIFMAPTRPLVKQQIDACYDITAIPKETTAELTGTKSKSSRGDVWKEKRVFFVTPQILQNDLNSVVELGTKIKCVVFDEAHKAKGNHAYCEVMRKLKPHNSNFRVLALSATPGSTINDVVEVVKNLLIAHVELRTDESVDVKPYTFERSLDTVVVPLDGKLKQVKEDYIKILETYTRVLIKHRIIHGNCSTLTKGRIFLTMKEYQQKQASGRDANYSEIMRSLNISVTLYHGFELLIRHGLRTFLAFFEEHIEKPLLRNNKELHNIMIDVRDYLGPAPVVELLPDGSIIDVPENTKFGHPKFYKLCDILLEHFSNVNDLSTRVIVFFEYKDSVSEALALLSLHRPRIRPMRFVGQGTITQRQQINVIKAFRDGSCNTLLSTCIGEEGLDVGDVDLIVCFDISNKSPVRMIQRMGRTGRKRKGRVIVLVTEGKEQQTLKECLIQKHHLAKDILNSGEVEKFLYDSNPRMVPSHVEPKCQKMHITIKKTEVKVKKKCSLKDMFNRISASKNTNSDELEDDIEMIEACDRIPKNEQLWNTVDPLNVKTEENTIKYSRYVDKQRYIQAEGKITHSETTNAFVSLLKLAEMKHYNIPVTQEPRMPSNFLPQKMNDTNTRCVNSNYKQSDIRNMFAKAPSLLEKDEIQITEISNACNDFLNELEMEIKNYLSIKACALGTDAYIFDRDSYEQIRNRPAVDLTKWLQPDLKIFDGINEDDLNAFAKCTSLDLDSIPLNTDSLYEEYNRNFEISNVSKLEKCNESNQTKEIDINGRPKEECLSLYSFETPKSFCDLLKSKPSPTEPSSSDAKILLEFFKLESIQDLFEPPENCRSPRGRSPILFKDESPILTYSQYIVTDSKKSASPILSGCEKATMPVIGNKARRHLFSSATATSTINKPNLSNLWKSKKETEKNSKNIECETLQVEDAIGDLADFCNLSTFGLDYKESSNNETLNLPTNHNDSDDFIPVSPIIQKNNYSQKRKSLDLDDTIFNLSSITQKKVKPESEYSGNVEQNCWNIEDKKNIQKTSPEESSSSKENKESNKNEHSQQHPLTVTQMLEIVDKCDREKTQNVSETSDVVCRKNGKTPKRKLLKLKGDNKTEDALKDISNLNDEFTNESSCIPTSPIKKTTTNKTVSTSKNKRIIKSDSDDEFESVPSNKWIKRKPTPSNIMSYKKSPTKINKVQKPPNKFIDFEAEVSDDGVSISDDEVVDDSILDSSFINDDQAIANCTEMQVHYLESVKDCRFDRGPFKIPKIPKEDVENVFSQVVDYSQNTYLEDSFCVNEDVIETDHGNNLSELELAEMLLKEKRQQKKLARLKGSKFRRRIFNISSDSSDCES